MGEGGDRAGGRPAGASGTIAGKGAAELPAATAPWLYDPGGRRVGEGSADRVAKRPEAGLFTVESETPK